MLEKGSWGIIWQKELPRCSTQALVSSVPFSGALCKQLKQLQNFLKMHAHNTCTHPPMVEVRGMENVLTISAETHSVGEDVNQLCVTQHTAAFLFSTMDQSVFLFHPPPIRYCKEQLPLQPCREFVLTLEGLTHRTYLFLEIVAD